MKKHTGLISRFHAWQLHRGSEWYNRQVDERKKDLFSDLQGQVLEIGPGTGANLEYYSENVTLTGLEPNPYMQNYIKEKDRQLDTNLEIMTGMAEEIPLPDEHADAVVSTLVLCSVDSLKESLAEIKRVLKPGGSFLFIEHVAAPDGTWLRSIQRGVKPVWKCVADGCNPDRATWKAIESAGFGRVEIEHFRLSLPVVAPHIMGKAVKD